MGGPWRHRRTHAAHKRNRTAMLALVEWGITPCYRCQHPLEAGDLVELDHAPDGSLGGFSHGRSPCRICQVKCNPSAGGKEAALNQGKHLRSRACCICGKQFTASRGTDGSHAATCGSQPCLNALRASRKNRAPDPDPPAQTGRSW